MEKYIALLIFIVPGFISKWVYAKLNFSEKRISDFRDTIIAITFNLFISYISLILVYIWYKGDIDIQRLCLKFNDIFFILIYTTTVLLLSILLSIALDRYKEIPLKFINLFRVNKVNDEALAPTFYGGVFSKLFIGNNYQLVSVYKGEKEIMFGSLDKLTTGINSNLELSVVDFEIWKDYRNCLKVKNIYYDADRDIKIVVYDGDEFIAS